MPLKVLIFVRGTKGVIKRFPELARRNIGWQLRSIQLGEEPADWRAMPIIGPGVKEIRIHEPHEHRVIFIAQYPEAIYVLHAFEKKSQKTPQRHIDTARAAYAKIQEARKSGNRTTF